MTYKFSPKLTRNGGVIQSAMPKVPAGERTRELRANGLLIRGVVTATYVYDADQAIPTRTTPQRVVYCDVFLYSSLPGTRINFLPRCLVTQDRAGLHEGDIWAPRATTVDISGSDLDIANLRGSDPFDWDGDHVLVGFMDDSLSLPCILREIPHPNADVGKSTSDEPGVRLRLVATDGQPRQWKHRGARWGVDDKGNWLTDLTAAHNGVYNPDGTEPDPPEDGSSGTYTLRIQPGGFYKVVGPDDSVIEVRADGRIQITSVTGEQIVQLDPDGTLSLSCVKQGSTMVMAADGSITVTSGPTNPTITHATTTANIDAAVVNVGVGAVQAAMLGDQWQAQHTAYDSALIQTISQIVALLGEMLPKLSPPPMVTDPITGQYAALVTQAGTTLPPFAAALTSGVVLSGSVKVKT